MKTDYYKTLKRRVVTQTSDGGGSYTESVVDTEFQGFIGMLSGNEIVKNKAIGNMGTARLLTESTFSKADRIVDVTGYFSEAGTVYEITWCFTNDWEKYYDLKII